LENLRKIKKTVDSIIDKGLKDDMGCFVLQVYSDRLQDLSSI